MKKSIATPAHTARHLAALLVAIAVVFAASQAFAFDAYKDRHGTVVGIGIGGGAGGVHVDETGVITGLDGDRQLGLHLNAMLGGGVNHYLVLGAEANWWIRTVQINDNALDHQHLSFNAIGNLYLLGPLYLQAGAGFAYAVFDTFRAGEPTFQYREMGLAAKVGLGFEYFLNGTVAAGAQLGYTRHFYANADFDTLAGGITLRWY
jgi:hypothetical protein